jgi:hypothetical protein
MKAPSEGNPNITMVTLLGACAAAGAGVSAAKPSAVMAHSVDRKAGNKIVILFVLQVVYSSRGPLVLGFVIEFEITAPPNPH